MDRRPAPAAHVNAKIRLRGESIIKNSRDGRLLAADGIRKDIRRLGDAGRNEGRAVTTEPTIGAQVRPGTCPSSPAKKVNSHKPCQNMFEQFNLQDALRCSVQSSEQNPTINSCPCLSGTCTITSLRLRLLTLSVQVYSMRLISRTRIFGGTSHLYSENSREVTHCTSPRKVILVARFEFESHSVVILEKFRERTTKAIVWTDRIPAIIPRKPKLCPRVIRRWTGDIHVAR